MSMIKKYGNEFNILLFLDYNKMDDLPKGLIEMIRLNRDGLVDVEPGYDGVYGIPKFKKEKQSYLNEFISNNF